MGMPSKSITIYHLEMCDRKAFCARPGPAGFDVAMVAPPRPELNRRYYGLVGSQWQWTDRLKWSDDDWHRYVHRDGLGTWIGQFHDQPAGYFELESQADGNIEIAYFGLLHEFIGQGLGGALLSAAVQRAWNLPDTRRVWVHTCTHDHQHALDNYLKRGFEIFRTEHRHAPV